jgi:hypothetical protein
MQDTLRVFYRVITEYTDLRWAKTRDDLISKIIKVLRAFGEGKTPEEVIKEKTLSAEVEESLSYLYDFVQRHQEELDRLINALSLFLKSPAPCKIKIIKLTEVFVEDRRSSQEGDF